MSDRRLLLFAKLPEPGKVKTRLIPWLGAEAAARLYEAFLDDSVALCRSVQAADVELWVPGSGRSGREGDDRGYFRRRYPGLPLRRQVGAGLGERLIHAFGAAFGEGAERVVVTGSDHPTLPRRYLNRAFAALTVADLVIGPSTDGGYYLVGLRRCAWPRAAGLFRGVPWSTSGVLEHTRSGARRLGLCRSELPEWYDVDERSDVRRLRRDVDARSRTGGALDRLVVEAPD